MPSCRSGSPFSNRSQHKKTTTITFLENQVNFFCLVFSVDSADKTNISCQYWVIKFNHKTCVSRTWQAYTPIAVWERTVSILNFAPRNQLIFFLMAKSYSLYHDTMTEQRRWDFFAVQTLHENFQGQKGEARISFKISNWKCWVW